MFLLVKHHRLTSDYILSKYSTKPCHDIRIILGIPSRILHIDDVVKIVVPEDIHMLIVVSDDARETLHCTHIDDAMCIVNFCDIDSYHVKKYIGAYDIRD